MKAVVYTAITGRISDELRIPVGAGLDPVPGVEFVCFTDRERYGTRWGPWVCRKPVWSHPSVPRRTARWHKANPHILFPDAALSLWQDGCFELRSNLNDVFRFLDTTDVATFEHPERDCIYREKDACLKLRKDFPETMERQVARYRAEGYPERNGLAETTCVLRRHTPGYVWEDTRNPVVRTVSVDWGAGDDKSVCAVVETNPATGQMRLVYEEDIKMDENVRRAFIDRRSGEEVESRPCREPSTLLELWKTVVRLTAAGDFMQKLHAAGLMRVHSLEESDCPGAGDGHGYGRSTLQLLEPLMDMTLSALPNTPVAEAVAKFALSTLQEKLGLWGLLDMTVGGLTGWLSQESIRPLGLSLWSDFQAAVSAAGNSDLPKAITVSNACQALNEAWWHEMAQGSLRDQLSFDYVCWKLKIPYTRMGGARVGNPFFTFYPHHEVPGTGAL